MSLRNRPTSNAKYSELPTQDPSTIEYVEEKESIVQRIVQWFHSLFWVLLCVFSWRYTKLFDVLRHDERINITMFYFSGVLLTINVILFVYLSLISAIIMRKGHDYMVTEPTAIYIMTGVGVTLYLTSVITIWPIWSAFSLGIVAINYIGLMLLPTLIPFCS